MLTAVEDYDAWVVLNSEDELEGSSEDLLPVGTWDETMPHDDDAGIEEAPGDQVDLSYNKRKCRVGSTSGERARTWRYSAGSEEYAKVSSDVSGKELEYAPVVLVEWIVGSTVISSCSGTLYDGNKVLTAGHCVLDKSTNTEADPSAVKVTKFPFGASSPYAVVTAEVVNLDVNDKYETKHQLRYDWAVLKVDTSLGVNHFMGLSGASDNRLNTWSEHRSAGYPAA